VAGEVATRFCLIRHGETPWNAQRRIQGQTDIALNPHGHWQARAAARWLREQGADALYTSDLARARDTALAVGVGRDLVPRPLPALRERRYGIFEGLTYGEAKALHPEVYERFECRQPDFALPGGGESLDQLRRRVVDQMRALAVAHAGQTVLVVTHGGVLDIANRFVRGIELAPPRDFVIPNAGLHWVSVVADRWQIDDWAVTAHLESSLDEL
jgi:probable phosphoglycerate mutase